MNHYWTSPIKQTFKWLVEKRNFNGETLKKEEFDSKTLAESFLNEKNFYVNGELVHTTSNNISY